jgi:hypothetical protein
MKLPKYQLKGDRSLRVFEFISEGPKGRIPKIIKYSETNEENVYNLAFGNKNVTGDIDDLTVSDNRDSEKIIATVVSTIYAFTDKHPERMVFATGSTKARTRLYRMGITKYIIEIKKDFEVLGFRDGNWHPFRKDEEYDAFLAIRKR